MATESYQIIRVRRSASRGHGEMAHHNHIVAVELSNGLKWDVWPRVVEKIRQGVVFYTYGGGARALVYAQSCRRCGNPYITTSPDGIKADNLDSLPLF